MKDASAHAVLDYLKALAGVRDDSELARLIGYSKQALSTARTRGKISLKMLAKASIYFEKSVDELRDEASAFEFAADCGSVGKYAYPIQPNAQRPDPAGTYEKDDLSSRLVRLRNGQARRAFAEQMGTTESTLRNYEKGISSPTADFLAKVCQILRVSPEWLLLGETKTENEGAKFFPPAALIMQADQDEAAKMPRCPECVALKAELQAEKEERRNLAEENRQLYNRCLEQERIIGELRLALQAADGGGSGSTAATMANTA